MAYIDTINTYIMPVGVAYEDVACDVGEKVVGPFSSSTWICQGLSSVAATMVLVCGISSGGIGQTSLA